MPSKHCIGKTIQPSRVLEMSRGSKVTEAFDEEARFTDGCIVDGLWSWHGHCQAHKSRNSEEGPHVECERQTDTEMRSSEC